MEIFNPVNFPDNSNIENITSNLNKILEDMIKKIRINGSGHIIDGGNLFCLFSYNRSFLVKNKLLECPHSNKLIFLKIFFPDTAQIT